MSLQLGLGLRARAGCHRGGFWGSVKLWGYLLYPCHSSLSYSSAIGAIRRQLNAMYRGTARSSEILQ